jgi:hypothetical protein
MRPLNQTPPIWQPIADELTRVPDDQRVAMLAHYQATAVATSDLEMLRAVKAYREHQEELRQALIERARQNNP